MKPFWRLGTTLGVEWMDIYPTPAAVRAADLVGVASILALRYPLNNPADAGRRPAGSKLKGSL